MYNASFRVPFFWIDDVYVTGMLAREVGVTQTHFDSAYMLSRREFLQKSTAKFFFKAPSRPYRQYKLVENCLEQSSCKPTSS